MVEKIDNITPQAKAKNAAQGDDWAASTKNKSKEVRTSGWWLFDTLVHGGINGVGNIAASLAMVRDRSNYKVNQLIDAKKNGTKVTDSGVFTSKLNVSEKDRRKSYLSDINIPFLGVKKFNFYEFSNKIDTKSVAFFDYLGEKGLNKVPVVKNLLEPLGKYTGGILFLAWGGHVTNSIMWLLESPNIKPKLVRAFDKLIDGFNSLRGQKPTEEELSKRAEIYKKLDSDLAGKSVKGVWGARFAGILSVIGVASVAEAIDVAATNADPSKQKTGILRGSQAFFKGAQYHQGGARALGYKADYGMLSQDKTSVAAARANYFADQTVTEILGTGLTTSVQYAYLMMREFLGIGPKTNVGDEDKNSTKSKAAPKAPVTAQSKANTSPAPKASVEKETQPKTTKASTDTELKKTAGYREKNQPTGENYQDKTSTSQDVVAEQMI
ncbi:MAG: hypothetical protein P8P30_06905 [Rickettsiales bacterium]|nr:hypothetical protein [Rickettsiales bacterium]